MKDQEGVIKYQLQYTESLPVKTELIREVNAWRRIFFLLGLIGQEPGRYGGYGFGNVSCRLKLGTNAFLISGTQTAHLPELFAEHYVLVSACDPVKNRIVAEGPVKPSSEALTHGAIYDADTSVNFVFHVHSPDIWREAEHMGLPLTAPGVSYGTPEMAKEIKRLFKIVDTRASKTIVMGGHEDGVVTFGETADVAGQTLIACFSKALQLKDQNS